MPFSFLKSSPSAKPPSVKQLSAWLCGKDPALVKKLTNGCIAALLEGLDQHGIVEGLATPDDLADGGTDEIKGQVVRLLIGREAPPPRPLTASRIAVAEAAYDQIRKSGYGELFAAAQAAALFNAMFAWYDGAYQRCVDIATHVIDQINNEAGEAYRVRAFGQIMLGHYAEARDDLRKGLNLTPSLGGAEEPLAAMDALVPA